MKQRASGRFVLRLSPELHETLRREASREGVSLNGLCQRVLERHVSRRPPVHSPNREESDLVSRIAKALGDSLQAVVLFGSVARGSARKSSDIDLLIVLSSGQEITRGLYAEWDRHFSEVALSPHFVRLPDYPEEAGSVWLEASVDGIVWYDRDGLVARLLADIRRMIASGQISRGEAYGLPYWVRKNGEKHVQ